MSSKFNPNQNTNMKMKEKQQKFLYGLAGIAIGVLVTVLVGSVMESGTSMQGYLKLRPSDSSSATVAGQSVLNSEAAKNLSVDLGLIITNQHVASMGTINGVNSFVFNPVFELPSSTDAKTAYMTIIDSTGSSITFGSDNNIYDQRGTSHDYTNYNYGKFNFISTASSSVVALSIAMPEAMSPIPYWKVGNPTKGSLRLCNAQNVCHNNDLYFSITNN